MFYISSTRLIYQLTYFEIHTYIMFYSYYRISSWRPGERMPRVSRSRRTQSAPNSRFDAPDSSTPLSSKIRRRPRSSSNLCLQVFKLKNWSEVSLRALIKFCEKTLDAVRQRHLQIELKCPEKWKVHKIWILRPTVHSTSFSNWDV